MKRGLRDIAFSISDIDKLVTRADKMESLNDRLITKIYHLALDKVEFDIRKAIVDNYKSSGVGNMTKDYKSTGNLERAVRQSIIELKVSSKTPKIVISLKPGMPNYKGGSTLYTAAASIQYGSVRIEHVVRDIVDYATGETYQDRRSPLGKAAKASVKKRALTGVQSKRSENAISSDIKRRGFTARYGVDINWESQKKSKSKKSEQVESDAKTITVTNPHEFYGISDSEWEKIDDKFKSFVEQYIDLFLAGE